MANSKSRTRDLNAVMRVEMALKLRAQKKTYEEIAKLCGYASRGACHDAVMRELERVVVSNVEELRREESAMLDQLHAKCWERLESKEHEKAMLFAVDRLLAISERRSKLMGLDVKPDGLPEGVTIIREYGVEVSKV